MYCTVSQDFFRGVGDAERECGRMLPACFIQYGFIKTVGFPDTPPDEIAFRGFLMDGFGNADNYLVKSSCALFCFNPGYPERREME